MKNICIVTGDHLCRNPRVVKEATALSEAGYEVRVLGPVFSEDLAAIDSGLLRNVAWEHRATIDLRERTASAFERVICRGQRRAGIEAVRRLGRQTPHSLGYGMNRALSFARHEKADLYIGHQEVGAWVAYRLLLEGHTAGADIEDWYSRDLLPEAQKARPVRLLERCEAALLEGGAHVTTTSKALAGALADAFDAPEPAVIYNAFPWSDREMIDGRFKDRIDRRKPSLHWVSQTIGPGRGLETVFDSLRMVRRPVSLHLRGACSPGVEHRIRTTFPSEQGHELFFHGLVPPGELVSRIAEHDIGLAIEATVPDSRNMTVTNKILHYLLAGLAVVATDTAGQREIAAGAPEAVRLCTNNNPGDMAAQLNWFLESAERLAKARGAALRVARAAYCWERQIPVLLQSVERAVQERTAARTRAEPSVI